MLPRCPWGRTRPPPSSPASQLWGGSRTVDVPNRPPRRWHMSAPAATRPTMPTAPVAEALGGLTEAVSRLRTQAPVTEAASWANELRDEAITALDTAVKELQIGRASCRESAEITVRSATLKKQQK